MALYIRQINNSRFFFTVYHWGLPKDYILPGKPDRKMAEIVTSCIG